MKGARGRVMAVCELDCRRDPAREELVMREWNTPEDVLVDAFSMRTRYADGVEDKEKAGRLADSGVGKDIIRM